LIPRLSYERLSGMTTNEDLDDVAALLFDTGVQILADVSRSSALSWSKRVFLRSWGSRLQDASRFVASQKEAGLLDSGDIVALVRMDVEVAATYRDRRDVALA